MPDSPRQPARKILLIGWDSADWNIARPLMDAGHMPNLKRLVSEGVSGRLATLQPALSPMLWTSIATGKYAWKHGILGFAEPCPRSGGIRPITQLSRRTKTVWNIFNQQGWRNHVVGWWPSHPVEPLSGVVVSNHFQQAVADLGRDWPLRPGTVHPPRLEKNLASLRVHPAELDNEHILPFVPRAAEIDQTRDPLLGHCARILAEITGIHAAATAALQLEPWDFAAVYYDGLDHFGHGFMRFHPPLRPGVDERQFELYRHVVETAYRYHDMMLGTLLAIAGPETTVMLISDHGFEPGVLRPDTLPNEPAGPAAEHAPYGIFCLRGPGIRAGQAIHGACLLDIAPTLLQLAGLPVGSDLDGRVLADCFTTPPEVARIPSWDEVSGPAPDGRHPADLELDASEARQSLRQLVELGYIDEPSPNLAVARAETERELHYHLAQAYVGAGRHADAVPVLSRLWQRWPDESRFGTQLLFCHLALENAPEARATHDLLLSRKQAAATRARAELQQLLADIPAATPDAPRDERLAQKIRRLRAVAGTNPHALAFLHGNVLALEGRTDDALACFRAAEGAQTANLPSLYIRMGALHCEREEWTEAARRYQQVLALAPGHHEAHLGLAHVALRQDDAFAASGHALAAIEQFYHNPAAHFAYAVACLKLGKPRLAEKSLLVAVSQNPAFAAAHERLAALYSRAPLADPAAAARHQAEAAAARDRLAARASSPAAPAADAPASPPVFPTIAPVADRLPRTREAALVVVSGLPRSGTSLMMQMLAAAGLEPVTDGARVPDESNPRGYFEDERVKRLPFEKDRSWLRAHPGRAIKIVAPLLPFIPADLPVRIVFMQRPPAELLASQRAMLARDGKSAAGDDAGLARAFAAQLEAVNRLLAERPAWELLPVAFDDAVHHPDEVARRVAEFLPGLPRPAALATAAAPALHRNRAPAAG